MTSNFKPGQLVWYSEYAKDIKTKVVVWDCSEGITIKLGSGAYVKVSEDLLTLVKFDIEQMTQADLDIILNELEELRKKVHNA